LLPGGSWIILSWAESRIRIHHGAAGSGVCHLALISVRRSGRTYTQVPATPNSLDFSGTVSVPQQPFRSCLSTVCAMRDDNTRHCSDLEKGRYHQSRQIIPAWPAQG
jgi:hypothetical protein